MFPTIIQRISLVVFVTLSISFGIINLVELIQRQHALPFEQDNVSKWENRLQSLKEKLPANVTTVGYIADEDFRQNLPTRGEAVEFDLTKYTLSPIVVQRGVNDSWIIGNFSAKIFRDWLKTVPDTYETQDLGSGIYLIHRVKK